MPIYMAEPGQTLSIRQITGTDKVKTHLQNLGFVVGTEVMLINRRDENVILKIKGVTLAISRDLAKRILV